MSSAPAHAHDTLRAVLVRRRARRVARRRGTASHGSDSVSSCSLRGRQAELVETERATDWITTFDVGGASRPSAPVAHDSAGVTPFGFDVDRRGRVYVSEAFGGAPDARAVSSYALDRDGSLDVVSPSVGTTETAACWVVVSRDGRVLYVLHGGTGEIGAYAVDHDGGLTAVGDPVGGLPDSAHGLAAA